MTEPGQKMSLLEAYEQVKTVRKVCSFGKIIEGLDAADQAVLQNWLTDVNMSHYDVARLVTHAGHTVHRNTVAEHRRGVCRCNR